MKKLSLAIVLLVAPTFAYAWPWSMDQGNQISIKPQESVDPANPGHESFSETFGAGSGYSDFFDRSQG